MPHVPFIGDDGKEWVSVTTVTGSGEKPWLDRWKMKWGVLAIRKTRCANAVGTAFHSGAEMLSRGMSVEEPTNRRLAKMLERIDSWLSCEGVVVVDTERHVVSHKYKYHGTLDAVVRMTKYGKMLILIDYKSSAGIYEDMGEQLVAYAQAYYEETGIRLKIGLIVHVSKDKPRHKLTVKEFKLTKALLNKFLKKLKEYSEAHQ